jgi:hypothetical protein
MKVGLYQIKERIYFRKCLYNHLNNNKLETIYKNIIKILVVQNST